MIRLNSTLMRLSRFCNPPIGQRTALASRLPARSTGDVPLDLRLLGFHQDAEGEPFGTRLSQVVCGELIGEDHLTGVECRAGCLKVHDRRCACHVSRQIDHADKGQITSGEPDLKRLFDRPNVFELR